MMTISDVITDDVLRAGLASDVNAYLLDNCGFAVDTDNRPTADETRDYFTVNNFRSMFGECEFNAEQMQTIQDYAVSEFATRAN